jgi:hypothetical protein
MKKDISSIVSGILRFIVLAIGFAMMAGLISSDIMANDSISECSLVEITQEVFLFVCGFLFLIRARLCYSQRGFLLLVSGFFFCMFIRELDGLFDLVWHGFWIVPDLLVAALFIGLACSFKKTIIQPMALFFNSRSCIVISIGLGIVLVFSRIIGMKILWEHMMGVSYVPAVKNMVEEGTELMGYFLTLCGTLTYDPVIELEMKLKQGNSGVMHYSMYPAK